MKHKIKDFEIEIIDEPKQRHIVAWEKVSRQLRNEDAKPALNAAFEELRKINVTENRPSVLIAAYHSISKSLALAIEVINSNETLTTSSNHGVIVKAAIKSGWILSPELTDEQIDEMPAWQVTWIAERIGELYLTSTTIPKN